MNSSRLQRLGTVLRQPLLAVALGGFAALASATEPAPEALSISESLGLAESARALRDVPGWAPARIVVRVPPHVAETLPGFEADFRSAGAGAEVVFDRSGGWTPDLELLRGADAVIGYCVPEVFSAAGDTLFWLHSYSIGVDRCLEVADSEFDGKVFSNSKRLSGPAMAEHSIAMLMALARGLPDYYRAQMLQQWDRSITGQERFGELAGKTMLVVGLGGIGSEVAARAHGLGMRVIATRNSSREGPAYVDYVGLADELHKLAGEAHVIVNTLPLTDKTQGLLDARFFKAVKPGAIYQRGTRRHHSDRSAAAGAGKRTGLRRGA